MKKFDLLVYIGRFQPLHIGHVRTIEHALGLSTEIKIFLGSAYQPRTVKNPWLWHERGDMIRQSFSRVLAASIKIEPVRDIPESNQLWAQQIRDIVSCYHLGAKVGIIGHKKDESSFYLDLFPEWEFVEMENIDGLHATDIRDEYFGLSKTYKEIGDLLPIPVYNYLMEFRGTEEFEKLWEEIYENT